MPKGKKHYRWDAFICYASEDKRFVKALYDALRQYGLNIWWDKFSLTVGRSLRQAVDEGLAKSRFGIVVFSPSFFEKKFPQTELDGLFSRQMSGRDVILPVWHKIDAEQMREFAATLADKWAAKSSEGVPKVARQLVEVIKPKALRLEAGRSNAQRANTQFLSQLEQENPTLRFRLSTGQGVTLADLNAIQPVAGAVGSILFSGTRIDMFPRDPKKYADNPVTYAVTLRGQGAEKIKEAMRTGLPQEITDDEFEGFKTSLNAGLPIGSKTKGKLFVQPSRLPHRKVPVRIRFGSGETALTIPYMEMEQERAGTEEACYIARTRDGIFTLRSIVGLKPQMEGTIQTNTRLERANVHDLQKYNRATVALQQTGEVEIISLEKDAPVLKVKCSVEKPTEKDVMFRQFVDDLVRVADYFGLQIPWPDKVEESDIEALGILLAAADGKPIGNEARFSGVIVKSPENRQAFESMRNGGRMAVVQEEPFSFFGTQIEAGTLAYCVENVQVQDFETTQQKFDAAADGDSIEVTYETKSPVIVRRWDKARSRPMDK